MSNASQNVSPAAVRRFPSLSLALPDWVAELLPAASHSYTSDEERMGLAIDLARHNVQHGGGPFGAAVFDSDSGILLAPGVNIVVSSKWSGAHAEMVAIAIAQQVAATHDLGSNETLRYELVTSCEPCSMCFGATPWSGVHRLVCGAAEADARAIGFDEGPKPTDWAQALQSRGIDVKQDVQRQQANQVLQEYAQRGGLIYNGRSGS